MTYAERWEYLRGKKRTKAKTDECLELLFKSMQDDDNTKEIIKDSIIEAGLPKMHAYAVYQCEEMLRAAKVAGWKFVKVPWDKTINVLATSFWEKDPLCEELVGLLPQRAKLCATVDAHKRTEEVIEALLADNHALLLARMGDRHDDSHEKDTIIWDLEEKVRKLEESKKGK